MYYASVESPVGRLRLVADSGGLARIDFEASRRTEPAGQDWERDPGRLAGVARQLDEYFRRERTRFDLALAPRGTPFQLAVWRALLEIPYGCTITYRELARRVGRPSAFRAAGAANGRNPISIVVPCHRVIGSGGALTGYGGGLRIKAALLALEIR